MEVIQDGWKLVDMTKGLKPMAVGCDYIPDSFSGHPGGFYELPDGRKVQRFLNFGSPSPGFILEAVEKLLPVAWKDRTRFERRYMP